MNASEIDAECQAVIRAVSPGVQQHVDGAEQRTDDEMKSLSCSSDLLISTPPCPDYSPAGKNKGRLTSRGKLIL